MLKVGLTGGLGAGKTTVSQLFAKRGVAVIDTDVISHELTGLNGPAIPEIRQTFGEAVFNADGSLDRVALRAKVVTNEQARIQLGAILHPMIRHEVLRKLAETDSSYALVVVPLLVETGTYDEILDRVLVVDCSEQTQIERAMARGGWSEAEIRGMIGKQASREARLDRADDIINTDCSLEDLAFRVGWLHEKYLSLSHQAL